MLISVNMEESSVNMDEGVVLLEDFRGKQFVLFYKFIVVLQLVVYKYIFFKFLFLEWSCFDLIQWMIDIDKFKKEEILFMKGMCCCNIGI